MSDDQIQGEQRTRRLTTEDVKDYADYQKLCKKHNEHVHAHMLHRWRGHYEALKTIGKTPFADTPTEVEGETTVTFHDIPDVKFYEKNQQPTEDKIGTKFTATVEAEYEPAPENIMESETAEVTLTSNTWEIKAEVKVADIAKQILDGENIEIEINHENLISMIRVKKY